MLKMLMASGVNRMDMNNPMDWVVLGILIGLFLVMIFLFFWFNFMRRRAASTEKAYGKPKRSELELADGAYNAVLTTRSIARVMKRKGIETRTAEAILRDAQRELELGHFRSATTLAERARANLNSKRVKEKTEESGGDVFVGESEGSGSVKPDKTEEVLKGGEVFDEEPARETKKEDEISESFKFRSKMPENFMQAKFEITLAETAIIEGRKRGIDTYSAEERLRQARESFEREDYTNALGLALRAKKSAEGKGEQQAADMETKPVATPRAVTEQKPAAIQRIPRTLVAAKSAVPEQTKPAPISPGEKRTENHCSNCGVPVGEDDTFCRKCGAKLPPTACPTCRVPVDKDDRFCRKCGAKLMIITPEGPKYECPVCKTVIPKDATSCPKCGAEFE